MDVNVLRGLITLVLLVAFVALCFWAWSAARRADFEHAAALPLDDEPRPSPHSQRTEGESR